MKESSVHKTSIVSLFILKNLKLGLAGMTAKKLKKAGIG
jgi:hypothetical protein